MAEFETSDIPLDKIAAKYFGVTEPRTLAKWVANKRFPFPIFRAGTQKSQWLVSIEHFAKWRDEAQAAAEKAFKMQTPEGVRQSLGL